MSAVTETPSPLRPLRPEDVLADTQPRRGFAVPGTANRCDLDFTAFRVCDEANPAHVLFSYTRARGQVLPPPRARPNNARVIRYTFDESFFKTRRLACRFAHCARCAFFFPKNSYRIHLLTWTQNGIQHREPGHTEGRRAGAPAAAAHGGAALPARHAAARLRLHVRPRRRAQHQQPVGVHVRPPAAHHCPGFALHRTSTQSPRSVTLWKCRAQWRRCSTTRTR